MAEPAVMRLRAGSCTVMNFGATYSSRTKTHSVPNSSPAERITWAERSLEREKGKERIRVGSLDRKLNKSFKGVEKIRELSV